MVRNLEVPRTWTSSSDIVQFKNFCKDEHQGNENADASDDRCYVENSKVSESLLLMKFYSLSSGMVRHLLSDHDGSELDLPFEVTDQEQDIIISCRSSFILGRSGTGKTTVLTMKLIQKEQQHHMAMEGFQQDKGNASTNATYKNEVGTSIGKTQVAILRQLFVTVSPKLCYAVKQNISRLKRCVDYSLTWLLHLSVICYICYHRQFLYVYYRPHFPLVIAYIYFTYRVVIY